MIQIDRQALDRQLDVLDRVAQRDSHDDVLAEVRVHVEAGIIDNFRASRGPDGTGWPPRKMTGDGHPLLIDTQALVGAAGGNAGGHVARIADRTLDVGVDLAAVPYARVHNRGWRERNIPQREFLGVTEQIEQQIEELIADRLLEKMRAT